ncbi:tetratricopeptide repeat protein [Sulfitobacter sp. BDSS02]|nr:tetratricopeptide repeat protein [Sulfitobacter sp. BDSS02]MBR9850983.1 tetratricopeptide repeat protein [Paracoccaceae bacterium]
MSDTDSFIDEVNEEVRRDRLYAYFRRYGWIALVVIVAVVGGAAWNEYRKNEAEAQAQTLGDDLLNAMRQNEAEQRAADLSLITADTPGGNAIVEFSLAAAQAESGQTDAAVAALNNIATQGDLPEIYRQIAAFKALTLQTETLPVEERRIGFEALAVAGAPLRLLAEEQLALLSVESGDAQAAIDRFQSILQDAEATADLQQRAAQAIVALGGTPERRPETQQG